jgi:hypothetical protein
MGFVVDKVALGRFSPSTSVSPANLHSTNYSTITLIYHLGLYNRPEVVAVPGDESPNPLIIIIIIIRLRSRVVSEISLKLEVV